MLSQSRQLEQEDPDIALQYAVYGVTLCSPIRLNLSEAAYPSRKCIILDTAKWDTIQSTIDHIVLAPDEWYQHAVLSDGSLYLRWEEWFEFLVSADGTRVLCRNLSDVSLESFEAYLTNFAVSAALLQQGEELLHATVVEIDGRAIGLVGPSGAGKSTLAVRLISQGAQLITDDMLRLIFEEENALAHYGPMRLKLLRESADMLLQGANGRGQFNPLSGKFLFDLSHARADDQPIRLSALYQLNWPTKDTRTDGVQVIQLKGGDLFKAISASTMNSRMHLPIRLERQFRFAERLARTVPVFRLTYPRRYEKIDEVVAEIMRTAPP